jgi:hypothetical protein
MAGEGRVKRRKTPGERRKALEKAENGGNRLKKRGERRERAGKRRENGRVSPSKAARARQTKRPETGIALGFWPYR